MDSVREFTSAITRSQADLSPNFLKIANYILANPDEVALSSMRSIAARLELDPSNFVRFARFMSFSGYPELRTIFQKDLRKARTEYTERAQRLQTQGKQDSISSLLLELQDANNVNLEYIHKRNSAETLKQSARIMLKADHIFILGLRSSFPAAFALHYTCKMMRKDVYLSDGHGGTFIDDIRGIGPADAFVAIGMHPYTAGTVAATEYAAKCNASIITLTDSVLSPLATHADSLLTFSTQGPLIPGTIVPVMALVESLTAVMIATGGTRALAAIKDSEDQLHEFSTYITGTQNTSGTAEQ